MQKYHLDQRTGIDVAGEEKPRMASLKKNKQGLHAMITMSFGYAIEVSPLQTLTLYNAVANNGRMMKPYLVNQVLKDGIILKQIEPVVLNEKLADKKIIASAKSAMESVVTEGTGKYAFKGMSFPVAGKTGTAHVADGIIKYQDGVYQASFVGYFPADEPQYSCIVVIRTRPHAPLHYGGQLAAPVFREIAEKIYPVHINKSHPGHLQIEKDSNRFFYAGYTPDFKNVLSHLKMNFRDSANKAAWSEMFGKEFI
ncbi:MAG: peptidoglycan glycosyltransferase, partial [Bacteroidia bacterium]|nr:peptidoglycan glycosyltransferase [Bacteroidia bacterium]